LQLHLQDTEEALEELKQRKQRIQIDNTELKMFLHEENEEKQSLLQQLQAKYEALENL